MPKNMSYKKRKFLKDLLTSISKQSQVISVTHVGSFFEKELHEISDVDIVVIVESLTLNNYEKIKEHVENFNISKYFSNYKIVLNTTFGPLKISKSNNLVIHLMIYSLDDHVKHTIESPFTTLDWERSNDFKKVSLLSLKKTHRLSLQDFLNSYRGSSGYQKDLESKKISYKKYETTKGNINLISFTEDIDDKYEIEFSYHIMRNIIINYLKFITNKNTSENFKKNWKNYLPDLYEKYYSFFSGLEELKLSKDYKKGFNLNTTSNFIKDFNIQLSQFELRSYQIIFLRHMETELNAQGIFYGTHTDSKIITDKISFDPDILNKNYTIYSSESKRSISSAKKYDFENINISEKINEIQYGLAENMKFDEYEKKYYANSLFWKLGIDKRFPKGENHSDVLNRVKKHIDSIETNSILFTHLVPIRVFLGDHYNIPKKDWYKILIPHNKPIKFLKSGDKIFSNIDRLLLSEIFKNL
jgi:broad specificity phosphatase PhoE